MSKLRVNELETLDGLNLKDVAKLIDDINTAQVTTSTGEQTLPEALDDRLVQADLVGVFRVKNVMDFGAFGDGEANDTAAFNSAADGGGLVYIPEGTYLINDWQLPGNIKVFGVPGKSIIKKPDATSGNVVSMTAAESIYIFEDLVFDGNWQNQTPAQSSRILAYTFEGQEGTAEPSDMIINRCQFRSVEHQAVWYISDHSVRTTARVVVTYSTFKGMQPGSPSFAPQFVSIGNGGHALVHGNTFDSELDVTTDVTPPAVSISKRSDTSVAGSITVTSNDIYRCGRGGPDVSDQLGAIEFYSDAVRCIITGNNLFDSNGRIITGKTDSPDCIISGNVCKNVDTRPGGIGILAAAAGSTAGTDRHQWIISGNIVERVDGPGGIRIEGRDLARRVIITDNIVRDLGSGSEPSRGVYIVDATFVLISGNIFDHTGSPSNILGGTIQACEIVHIKDNLISNVEDGFGFNAPTATDLMFVGNELRGITRYGVQAYDIQRIVARSNSLFGDSGTVGFRVRNSTGLSPIRGNMIVGFGNPIAIAADPNNVYIQGENDS